MAFLRAFGSWLPPRRVANRELAPQLDTAPDWIVQVSGIEERRYASAEDTVASIGVRAAQTCLDNAGVAASELGMILVASGSSDRFCPGPASQIATALGLSSIPALDIPVCSAGSLIALSLASNLAPSVGKILVVGSEIMSRRIHLTPDARNTAILFGDGAGACLVDSENGFARIADSCLYTDGASTEILYLQDGDFHMDGSAVILQASRKIPRAITELLTRNHLTSNDIAAFILHQANLNLITRVANTLKAQQDRFFANIARYGNTSSASMLIAADEWWLAQNGQLPGPIVFAAFGAGLNWGALLALPR